MVYLPPPPTTRRSYAEAYNDVLTAHRRSPLTSASSVIILVAPDVDALCAARMLASLFKQDDVIYRIIPVAGISDLERYRDEVVGYNELHSLILINMGSILDLPSEEWFGEDFDNSKTTVHVIDSARPQNLSSLFGGGPHSERVVVWDDGEADKLTEEKKAWEALTYEAEPDSDEEDSEDGFTDEDEQEDDEEDYEDTPTKGKRRSLGEANRAARKRRKDENRPRRMTRDERDEYNARVEKHYMCGTWHGQSASGTIYTLATALERVDNDLLWLAILGLTFQYTTARISRATYDQQHSLYYDEVFRLNPPPPEGDKAHKSLNPDDESIRTTDELRFMLYRHWNLYDAMMHSSYVAGKLGIWKDKGRKRLTGLLAKMGFSIPQTQQSFANMDIDLKKSLVTKLNEVAPEYGLVEISYPSFMRCFGYRTHPLSAADAVEGISALLDVDGGLRMEIEVDGARNGGEWFGGGKVWEAHGKSSKWKRNEDRENIPPGAGGPEPAKNKQSNDQDSVVSSQSQVAWWVKNFWTAYDALTDVILQYRSASQISQIIHVLTSSHHSRGASIIDKQDIRTMRNHRVVVMQQGPDLALFSHPGVLSRLALWLVDALRDKVPGTNVSTRTKRKSLPFVVACLNENTQSYIVVGVMAALDFGDIRKNEFGLAFLDAKDRCNARTRHSSFDTSVLEINEADLKIFLETLCEAGY